MPQGKVEYSKFHGTINGVIVATGRLTEIRSTPSARPSVRTFIGTLWQPPGHATRFAWAVDQDGRAS